MKKNKIFLSLSLGALLFASASIFTSCKKDEKTEEEPTPTVPVQTNTEKLQGKTFKITALTGATPIGNIDLYSQLKDCQKDNLFTYETASFYKEDEGATKCDPMDNQTKTGTWKWVNNETEITITSNGVTWTSKVLLNDGTTFKTSTTQNVQGTDITVTTTMTKQ